jgi:signal transduction histidine kinase
MDNCPTASGLMLGAGRYAVITVNDTGAGVPEQARMKIFEPFFTTKKGTTRRRAGLGLAIVYRVARDHYGAIDVESAPGKDTSFGSIFRREITAPRSMRSNAWSFKLRLPHRPPAGR